MGNQGLDKSERANLVLGRDNLNYNVDLVIAGMTQMASETFKEIEKIRADSAVEVAHLQYEVPARQATLRAGINTGLIVGTLVTIAILACHYLPPDQLWIVLAICAGGWAIRQITSSFLDNK